MQEEAPLLAATLLLACEPDPADPVPVEILGPVTSVEVASADPAGGDPTTSCAVVDVAVGDGAHLEGADGAAALDVPEDAFSDRVQLALCRSGAPVGALTDAWMVQSDPPLEPKLPLQLAIRTPVSNPAAALFVPGPGDTEVRSLVAQHTDGSGFTSAIWHLGTSFAKVDDRALLAYEPSPTALDLVLVVDDTCSMLDEQSKLATVVPELLDALDVNAVDYHVGVVTTDNLDPTRQGHLTAVTGGAWVEPGTPGRDDVLAALLAVGNDGAELEEGLSTLYAASGAAGYDPNPGFLRPDAALVGVVVSSADDHSSQPVASVADGLYGLQRPYLSFDSLVHQRGDDKGGRYMELSYLLGGESVEVDGGDWTAFFDEIGEGLLRFSAMELDRDQGGYSVNSVPAGGGGGHEPELWIVPADTTIEPYPCAQPSFDAMTRTVACLSDVPVGAELWVLL